MSAYFPQTRLCLVGATGLTGACLIEQAVSRADVRIIGIARREAVLPSGARMEMIVADPSSWGEAIASAKADVLVCALGTTWRKADRDETAFRKVDHDLVLTCARAAKGAGMDHAIVVSSVGADPASRNFYLRVKGETEQALAGLGFRRLDILRPGLLRGSRGERRTAERLAMLGSPLLDLALCGSLRKYRSIRIETLAKAIFALAGEQAEGRFIHEHDALLRAAGQARG